MAKPLTNLSPDFSYCIEGVCKHLTPEEDNWYGLDLPWFGYEDRGYTTVSKKLTDLEDIKEQCKKLFMTGNQENGNVADIMALSVQSDFIRTLIRAWSTQMQGYKQSYTSGQRIVDEVGKDSGPLKMGVQNVVENWLKHSSDKD